MSERIEIDNPLDKINTLHEERQAEAARIEAELEQAQEIAQAWDEAHAENAAREHHDKQAAKQLKTWAFPPINQKLSRNEKVATPEESAEVIERTQSRLGKYEKQNPSKPEKDDQSTEWQGAGVYTEQLFVADVIAQNTAANPARYNRSLELQLSRQASEHSGDNLADLAAAIEDARKHGQDTLAEELATVLDQRVAKSLAEDERANQLDESKIDLRYLDIINTLDGKKKPQVEETPVVEDEPASDTSEVVEDAPIPQDEPEEVAPVVEEPEQVEEVSEESVVDDSHDEPEAEPEVPQEAPQVEPEIETETETEPELDSSEDETTESEPVSDEIDQEIEEQDESDEADEHEPSVKARRGKRVGGKLLKLLKVVPLNHSAYAPEIALLHPTKGNLYDAITESRERRAIKKRNRDELKAYHDHQNNPEEPEVAEEPAVAENQPEVDAPKKRVAAKAAKIAFNGLKRSSQALAMQYAPQRTEAEAIRQRREAGDNPDDPRAE